MAQLGCCFNLCAQLGLAANEKVVRGFALQPVSQALLGLCVRRIRAQFELDLYFSVRFTRWLAGVPRGPLSIGGRELVGEIGRASCRDRV